MELITQAAEDKDTDVAAWMQGRTPLGIARIPGRSIFPACEASKAQEAAAKFLHERTSSEITKNYTSYAEHGALAQGIKAPRVGRPSGKDRLLVTSTGKMARRNGHQASRFSQKKRTAQSKFAS